MTPQEIISIFDNSCAALQIPRQAHFQIQQIIQGVRQALAKAEAKEKADKQNEPTRPLKIVKSDAKAEEKADEPDEPEIQQCCDPDSTPE